MSRAIALVAVLVFFTSARAEDWPMWGRDKTRNMVSPEKNPPTDWQVEVKDKGKVLKPARNIKWSAQLGSHSMGAPVVSNGLVWVGTNNYRPRDPQAKGDASVLMCFRESDGRFLYQYVSQRRPGSAINDWPYHSLGCPPLVDGDRLWLLTNRCETLCLDIGPLRRDQGEPKIVWKVDMAREFGVFRHCVGMGMGLTASAAIHKDLVFAVTGNGVDESHENVPAPDAPSLICFNKHNGKVVWKENSPGKGILHQQCATPLVIEVNGKAQVIMPHGDGWLRSFDAETGKLIWKCDANPKDSKHGLGGRATRNEFMATPVWHGGRIYIGTGQDPEHYEGIGLAVVHRPHEGGGHQLRVGGRAGEGQAEPELRRCLALWRTDHAARFHETAAGLLLRPDDEQLRDSRRSGLCHRDRGLPALP